MSTYAGESLSKKIARAKGYQAARSVLPPSRLGVASVVALAGPNAHDVAPAMAFGITTKVQNITLIDRDEAGLAQAKDRYPGVCTFHGELSDAKFTSPIDLAVLDFCGMAFSKDNATGLRNVVRSVVKPGGLVLMTYARGQERCDLSKENLSGLDAYALVLKFVRENGNRADDVRAAMGADLITEAAGCLTTREILTSRTLPARGEIYGHMVWRHDYTSPYPMGMILVQFRRHWPRGKSFGGQSWKASSKTCSANGAELAEFAESVAQSGVDPCLALDCSTMQLAAYKAHRTMGTYSEA